MQVPANLIRSRNMQAVRSKNTVPEMAVRRTAHRLGLRFRLFRGDLPGRPDLTFPKFRTVLFVNGCFWHQHSNCPRSMLPRTNKEFWKAKLEANAARDKANYRLLVQSDWRVLVVWECELKHLDITKMLENWFFKTKRASKSEASKRRKRLCA
jgi:DNA mismatch endonuclease, patch repair protein